MTVLAIAGKSVRENGDDGLCCLDVGCGCQLDDFAPCGGEYAAGCEPAYKGPCTCGERCDFDMYASKKDVAEAQKSVGELDD